MSLMKRAFAGLVVVGALSAPALAGFTYNFYKLTTNNDEDLGGQLQMEVSDAGSGKVSFEFTNDVDPDDDKTAGSITQIYFDGGGVVYSTYLIAESAGVSYEEGKGPPNLPSGNTATPPFAKDWMAGAKPPTNANGVNSASEWVKFTFDLASGVDFDDLIALINDGSLRAGLHVQAIGAEGGSDSYINTVTIVPTPAAGLLGICGLLFSGMFRRR